MHTHICMYIHTHTHTFVHTHTGTGSIYIDMLICACPQHTHECTIHIYFIHAVLYLILFVYWFACTVRSSVCLVLLLFGVAGPSCEEGAKPLHQTREPLQSLTMVAEDRAKSITPLHIHFIRLLCHLHSHHSLLHTDDGCSCPVVLSPHLVSLAKRLEPIILPY